jgi:predicted RNA-binding protein with PIN domain
MALVRILIDGYSLLHNWPDLAPGKPRHSASARHELIHVLTRYHDATGTPITIFFDGTGSPRNGTKCEGHPTVEILFSSDGKTADDMIERATHRLKAYGDVLAVTDDRLERDTVTGLGGHVASCQNFIRMVENALAELKEDLKQYNRAERTRYRQKR